MTLPNASPSGAGSSRRRTRSRRFVRARTSGRAGCLPAFHPAITAPLVSQKGPVLVVPPTATDLKVARRESFTAEPPVLDEPDGVSVGRLDVGLHAVKLESREGVAETKPHPFAHVSLSCAGREPVVPEIGVLEVFVEDLAEVVYADQSPVVDSTHQHEFEVRASV